VTARLTPAVLTAIASIDEQSWVPIRYPHAIYDEHEQRWVSDAEVAETTLTAFTGRRRREHVTARLIVRRVRRLNPTTVSTGQAEMFAVYRYHAVFTDSPESMLTAEATHRDHAIVEQVIAELKNGPLAHLPSGLFTANACLAGLRRDRAQPHPRCVAELRRTGVASRRVAELVIPVAAWRARDVPRPSPGRRPGTHVPHPAQRRRRTAVKTSSSSPSAPIPRQTLPCSGKDCSAGGVSTN
jgi:hypothetical protein